MTRNGAALAPDGGTLPGWAELVAADGDGDLMFGATERDVLGYVDRGHSIVYVATPYSKRAVTPAGVWDRWLGDVAAGCAVAACARLLHQGVTAVSPIALAHQMVVESMWGGRAIDPLDQGLWQAWCAPLLEACDAVFIPDLPGWADSVGVLHEAKVTLARQRPVLVAASAFPGGAR